MKIECILQRDGGTVVELPGKTYHFAPQEDGRHVADVAIEPHIERFLSIPEAYRLLRTHGTDATALFAPTGDAPVVPVGDADLLGCSGYQPTFEIDGKVYALESIIKRAFQDSGLTPENWNDLPEETRALKLDIVLDAIADGEISDVDPQPHPAPQADQPDERAKLVELYVARFGKRPPNTMKLDTIKAKLAEGAE